jgi:hypothetical protein
MSKPPGLGERAGERERDEGDRRAGRGTRAQCDLHEVKVSTAVVKGRILMHMHLNIRRSVGLAEGLVGFEPVLD